MLHRQTSAVMGEVLQDRSSCTVNTGVSDKINYAHAHVLFSVLQLSAIPVSQHVQYQGPSPPKWNRAIIRVINYTCVYPAIGSKHG